MRRPDAGDDGSVNAAAFSEGSGQAGADADVSDAEGGRTVSYFDYQGKKIYFEEAGTGRPLLLLHGNTSSGMMFAPVIPMLTAKHHVIVPDFLGCGRSDRIAEWPADPWLAWSKQAAALCGYKGLEKIDVIGCSGGAIAAIDLALEQPGIVHAVVADSFEGLRADPSITGQIRAGREYAKQNEAFRSMLKAMHGDDWEAVVDADTEAVVRHARETGGFFRRPIEDLTVKLLLTGSSEDEMFPKGHYDALFGDICRRTDLAESHIFARGGHPAMMSNREEFISLCDAFFER